MNVKEYLKNCNGVYHATLDPRSSGVVRVHLVAPDNPKPGKPWVAVLNGYSLLPLQSSWAILLKEFLQNLEKRPYGALENDEIKQIVDETLTSAKQIFPKVSKSVLRKDLGDIVQTLKEVAAGKTPDAKIGHVTLKDYGKYMTAPHRMDLMVAPVVKNGKRNCNLKCAFCYCEGEKLAEAAELSTDEWKEIIDKCRKACIPALTFTGGEPTMRADLPELIKHAEWFVTRLNTNGTLLSEQLCAKLSEVSLDSVQITLYSYDKNVHNALVGTDGFDRTVLGIKNALNAGLDVSVNTPLCALNSDYQKTIEFALSLGVKYFSCSGLIPAGGALNENPNFRALSEEEITETVVNAKKFAFERGAEVAFTSPGWINADTLKRYKIVVPSCGACLSNMAIAPDGGVVPCQSWLSDEVLGNMLTDSWKKIWKSKACLNIRKAAQKQNNVCLLGKNQKERLKEKER